MNKRKIIIKILIFFLIFLIGISIIYYANYVYIPENGKFVKDCKSSKYYNQQGNIYNIGNNKYLILGGINKLGEKYLQEKRIHAEIYDSKKKKIIKKSDDLFYSLNGVIQLSNKNLFLLTSNNSTKDLYFAIIDKDTFNVTKIFLAEDLFDYYGSYERLHIVPLINNKVLITNGTYKNSTQISYIYDNSHNSKIKAPQYNNRYGNIVALSIDSNRYIITGGNYRNEYNKQNINIEICNIKMNKCRMQKSKLSIDKPNRPLLFKTKENKVLIIDLYNWNEYDTIQLFDPKTDSIEILGKIPKNGIEFRKYTQLKDGNILITGGERGILLVQRVRDAYIFDVHTRELKKIKSGMKYGRSGHLTKVLENGDVLICGGRFNLTRCERYIQKK